MEQRAGAEIGEAHRDGKRDGETKRERMGQRQYCEERWWSKNRGGGRYRLGQGGGERERER